MILYASRTGTRRNLAAMRAHGWRLLVSATGVWRAEGFPYAIDNGAWTAYRQGASFDARRYRGLVAALGKGADWIVLPDAVGDAAKTASMTDEWLAELSGHRLLAVIQDGAEAASLERLLPHVHGFFLGGSDEYKLRTMSQWGDWCKARGRYYHVGRVNSARRIALAARAGADSVDGTSATRYAVTTAPLTSARDEATRQSRLKW